AGELVERRGQRAALVRSRHRQECPTGRQQRQPLLRRESQRAVEVLGEADPDVAVDNLDLDQTIGRVRREPAQREQLEVVFELGLGDAEAGGDLREGGARMLGDPGHERQHPSQSRACERPGAHAAPRAIRSSQSTISARSSGGAMTSAESSKPSTNERNAAVFVTGSSSTTPPSSRRSFTEDSPTWSTTAAACDASTRTRAATTSCSPYCHG